MQEVRIQGPASRGGAKLMLLSALVLLSLLFGLIWVQQLGVIYAIALVAALLGLFAGWAKLAEPQYFLQYDDKGVCYCHRHGSWRLPWQSFLYSGVPQYQQQRLGYIGFKVTDYDSFLAHLPLRLAVRIMTEQRALYIEAVRQSCSSGQCASEFLAESSRFCTAQQQYSGIKAAFGWRMQHLSAATGFDIFVPVNFAESDSEHLCRQINQARLQLIQNTVT
ncbi:DUF2982 domain-containing protein [Rheinheimera sp. YQF-2]|uniref:DUF2982 domain-containing protein n=1 Tax=Rheinheimera lutimaris TaxID=2740584 RepID=A0A7Y5EH14_9GAMM|nr:DUF2982 domain-containing protein [Rheinheimera lutimaris]NRQ41267.1 DUF2982 domain-containing protein [Rheinheimera lutimaris]